MKILFIGGHLAPLLAVLDILPKNIEVLVIGRKHTFERDEAVSLEYQTFEDKKIKIHTITTARLQRNLTPLTILSLFKLPVGIFQAFRVIVKYKPDCIAGFGGYLQIPVIFAAFLLRVPIVIHEQTLEAGLANKICSFFSQKICISWQSSEIFFPGKKTVLTGNPIRQFKIQSFNKAQDKNSKFKIDKELPLLYITGGSSGAHALNVLVEGCLEKLLDNFIIIHQSGDAKKYDDFERLQKLKLSLENKKKERYILEKFIDPFSVGSIIRKSDLVISRSGMNTISELIYFKKAALLIPLPISQKNEQMKNALFLKNLGLAEVVSQNELTSDKMLELILTMVNNKEKYKINSAKNENLVNTESANKILEVILSTVKKNEK